MKYLRLLVLSRKGNCRTGAIVQYRGIQWLTALAVASLYFGGCANESRPPKSKSPVDCPTFISDAEYLAIQSAVTSAVVDDPDLQPFFRFQEKYKDALVSIGDEAPGRYRWGGDAWSAVSESSTVTYEFSDSEFIVIKLLETEYDSEYYSWVTVGESTLTREQMLYFDFEGHRLEVGGWLDTFKNDENFGESKRDYTFPFGNYHSGTSSGLPLGDPPLSSGTGKSLVLALPTLSLQANESSNSYNDFTLSINGEVRYAIDELPEGCTTNRVFGLTPSLRPYLWFLENLALPARKY